MYSGRGERGAWGRRNDLRILSAAAAVDLNPGGIMWRGYSFHRKPAGILPLIFNTECLRFPTSLLISKAF